MAGSQAGEGMRLANSKKKCKHCGIYSKVEEGYQAMNRSFFCSEDHAVEWAREKAASKVVKAYHQKYKKEKQTRAIDLRRKDIRWQHKQTQNAFNKLRRLQEFKWFQDRGLQPVCISCGKPLGGDVWACGHLKPSGNYKDLTYDPMNTYLQHNKRCNSALSGDIHGTNSTMGYREGLKHRFGEAEGQKILDYCDRPHEPKNYTCEQLQAMRKKFNKEIRELEDHFEYMEELNQLPF